MTIAHLYYALTHCRGFGVVSDHYYRLVEAVIQFLKHVEDERGVLGIQVSGRFVSQNDGRTGNYRTRQRHSLLLAARQFQRFMMQLIFQTEQAQHIFAKLRIAAAVAVNSLRQSEISFSRQSAETG